MVLKETTELLFVYLNELYRNIYNIVLELIHSYKTQRRNTMEEQIQKSLKRIRKSSENIWDKLGKLETTKKRLVLLENVVECIRFYYQDDDGDTEYNLPTKVSDWDYEDYDKDLCRVETEFLNPDGVIDDDWEENPMFAIVVDDYLTLCFV